MHTTVAQMATRFQTMAELLAAAKPTMVAGRYKAAEISRRKAKLFAKEQGEPHTH